MIGKKLKNVSDILFFSRATRNLMLISNCSIVD